MNRGAENVSCGSKPDARRVAGIELADGMVRGTMEQPAASTADSPRVLVFRKA